MLIEIHMIQNHTPSNINRDDLGAPKTCMFGGTLRARISSQCLKRSIRRSEVFRTPLAEWLGVRTKYFPDLVREKLPDSGIPKADHAGIVLAASKIAKREEQTSGKAPEETEDDRPKTAQLIFLGPQEADAFIRRLERLREDDEWASAYKKLVQDKLKGKALQKFHRELRQAYAKRSVDVSLFGRMTTSEAFENVEAAMEVAHALSTHDIRNEVDYFTAVDDLETGTGAGHVAENQYNSACYYKYFSLDWDLLKANLAGDDTSQDELAGRALGHFIRAAACTVPTGKKKGHANNNLPDGVLVEIKREKIPTSYANAFAASVQPDAQGLIAESILALGHYVGSVVNGYGIDSRRLWFAPQGFALEYVPPKADDEQTPPQPVSVATPVTSLDALIEKTLSALGLDWPKLKQVRDAEDTP